MNSAIKSKGMRFAIGTILIVLLASCGSSSETTNKVPTATNPDPSKTNLTPTTTTPDSRIPDLSEAVAIALVDKTNYTGLSDLAQNIFPPVVGDALVSFALTGDRSTTVSGKILIAFEDAMGFWGAELSSFDGTGYQSNGSLDIIFADDEFAVRVIGSQTSGVLNGSIYYRLRQTGDVACKKRTITCDVYYPPGYYGPYVNGGGQCDTTVNTAQLASECRQYLIPGSSSVKQLGTFKGNYSTWLN